MTNVQLSSRQLLSAGDKCAILNALSRPQASESIQGLQIIGNVSKRRNYQAMSIAVACQR